ncbi:hypothetical protein [Streptomyces sp. NPDC097619]|uniref:hypothetical protein n=1 Tax=Streptomyces sp. NPDC097619 TaxID=3157228 RepID=UPI00332967CE
MKSEESSADPVGTARQITALLGRIGLDRDEVLRVEGEGGLAYAAGLPEEQVRALLRGERPARGDGGTGAGAEDGAGDPDGPEERHRRVVSRIVFLRRTRLRTTPDGGRRPYSLAEIANGAGTSAQWLDKMIKTGKAPNLDHASGIAAFFGEGIEFLVAEPAEALDRVLQAIHKDLLERTVARQDEDIRRLSGPGPAGSADSGPGIVAHAARALADVPDDTAGPILALIESIARRSREERSREEGAREGGPGPTAGP